jgi:hypothetical protein
LTKYLDSVKRNHKLYQKRFKNVEEAKEYALKIDKEKIY